MGLACPAVISQPRIPDVVAPGDPLVVTFIGRDVREGYLSAQDGTVVASSRSFTVEPVPGVVLGCLVFGVRSDVGPGNYHVELVSGSGQRSTHTIQVVTRNFRSEQISLSQSLTELREREDPQKTAQRRALRALLLEFNPEAVYHAGPFVWPVELTRRTALFGDRRTYLYADGGTAFVIHGGLDLASPSGTPVRASGAGAVRMAEYRIVEGNTVVIEHLPGVFSVYYHLESASVAPGDTVVTGQEIGRVGATGLATGPHLHWEFRIGGVSVDPEHVLPGLLVDFDR
jgi:hypothetical protein